ncbi:MAG: HAD family hydrolase [Gemmatimonadales bacterium]
MPRRLVLFDIDGTLLLSAGAGRRAILAALADHVADFETLTKVRFDGKTDPQIVTELLAAAGDPEPEEPGRITRVLQRYVELLERDLALNGHRAATMPGVPELLDLLEGDDALIGLLTGNVVPGARLKLAAVRIDPDRFRVGAFGSDHARRFELPPIAARRAEPFFGRVPSGAEVVIIGDTPDDVCCAASIGARTVGVATGAYSEAELRDAGASVVLPDFRDVPAARRAILDGDGR